MIVVNFKTYESATGLKAHNLARIHEAVSNETGVAFVVAVQSTDIYRVSNKLNIPVFAQHVDIAGYGSHTGQITIEAAKEAGASGTILNHSEYRLEKDVLKKTVARARELGLTVIVCAESVEESVEIVKMNPDYIALEPPELIGGDISVTTANPEIISSAAEKVGEGRLLVGAGVKKAEDIRLALERGAAGVLLASGVTKAKNPGEVLRDLAAGFTK